MIIVESIIVIIVFVKVSIRQSLVQERVMVIVTMHLLRFFVRSLCKDLHGKVQ